MTMKLVLKNEGNVLGDGAEIRGLKSNVASGGDPEIPRYAELTGMDDDKVFLGKGESVEFLPPCGHYDERLSLSIKGNHGVVPRS